VARAHHNHGARERKKAEPMHPGIITRSLAHGIKTGIYETSSSMMRECIKEGDSDAQDFTFGSPPYWPAWFARWFTVLIPLIFLAGWIWIFVGADLYKGL
jgi:hypothetical protein